MYTRNLEADLAVRLDGAARELKECQDELAQAQSMQARATAESPKFNASATNYARNSSDALKRPIRCTGTLDTPEWM